MAENSFTESGQIVDVINKRIYTGRIFIEDGIIKNIEETSSADNHYILPGFIDAHVHIESSMLVPAEFARIASVHGTVGAVCDPHEIANVLGMDGIQYMINDAAQVDFHFCFGAPPCVPSTAFETSGGEITVANVQQLLNSGNCHFLSEVMNYMGVINGDRNLMRKIEAAIKLNMPIDGHAPGLTGEGLRKYVSAGISTDHECISIEEAREKISLGMKIIIREGSAAKNFDALIPLISEFPDRIMFCTDDIHPHDLLTGHINLFVRKAIYAGYDQMDVIRAATYNPVLHYHLSNGLLRKGDCADMIVVDNLKDFNIQKTIIKGNVAAENGESLVERKPVKIVNNFNTNYISADQIAVPSRGGKIKVIETIDGQLETKCEISDAKIENDQLVSDTSHDILKLVVVCRYNSSPPSVGFVHGFGLRAGSIAGSIAHDSHNIIAVGADDVSIKRAINLVIKERGGLAYVYEDESMVLPLPVAGLVSDESFETVAEEFMKLRDMVKNYMDCKLTSPFMTLSFLSLEVIPELKLSDKGLFDVNTLSFTDLFVPSE
jgi:adenine deaminase